MELGVDVVVGWRRKVSEAVLVRLTTSIRKCLPKVFSHRFAKSAKIINPAEKQSLSLQGGLPLAPL